MGDLASSCRGLRSGDSESDLLMSLGDRGGKARNVDEKSDSSSILYIECPELKGSLAKSGKTSTGDRAGVAAHFDHHVRCALKVIVVVG